MLRVATALILLLFASPAAFAMTESEAGAHAVIEKTVGEVLIVLSNKSAPAAERIRSIDS